MNIEDSSKLMLFTKRVEIEDGIISISTRLENFKSFAKRKNLFEFLS